MLQPGIKLGVPYPTSLLNHEGPTYICVNIPASMLFTALKTATLLLNQPRGAYNGSTSHPWENRPGKSPSQARMLAQNHLGSEFWYLPYLQHSSEGLRDTNSGWHIPLTALRGEIQTQEDQSKALQFVESSKVGGSRQKPLLLHLPRSMLTLVPAGAKSQYFISLSVALDDTIILG